MQPSAGRKSRSPPARRDDTTHASHVVAGTALALAALAFPASAEILAMVNYETKSADSLKSLKSPMNPGPRKEGIAIIDVDKPTQAHGTPPALLRCELAAVGYREVDFIALTPADGYLAVFVPPGTLPPSESIRPCRQ